jgi:hypothetical protein
MPYPAPLPAPAPAAISLGGSRSRTHPDWTQLSKHTLMANAVLSGNWFADTVQTDGVCPKATKFKLWLI